MISLKQNQKKKQIQRLLIYITIGIFLSGSFTPAGAADYTMAKYVKLPPFISREVKPNVIIALDISGSMKAVAYRDVAAGGWSNAATIHDDFNPAKNYYGYFSHTDTYKYNATKQFFEIDNAASADQAHLQFGMGFKQKSQHALNPEAVAFKLIVKIIIQCGNVLGSVGFFVEGL